MSPIRRRGPTGRRRLNAGKQKRWRNELRSFPNATPRISGSVGPTHRPRLSTNRSAVQKADALVADVMKRLAECFASERSTVESQWDRGDNVTTEDLRVALQRY